jgi:hypothetical protein
MQQEKQGSPDSCSVRTNSNTGIPSAAKHVQDSAQQPAASTSCGGIDAATQKFKSGIGSFQSLIDELVLSVDRERDELRRDREELEREKKLFYEERERVNQVLNDNEQVSALTPAIREHLNLRINSRR